MGRRGWQADWEQKSRCVEVEELLAVRQLPQQNVAYNVRTAARLPGHATREVGLHRRNCTQFLSSLESPCLGPRSDENSQFVSHKE